MSLHLSKYHIVGNHMPRLISVYQFIHNCYKKYPSSHLSIHPFICSFCELVKNAGMAKVYQLKMYCVECLVCIYCCIGNPLLSVVLKVKGKFFGIHVLGFSSLPKITT